MSWDFSNIRDAVTHAARTLRRDGARVVVADSLTRQAVEGLANERVSAIHIRGFFDPKLAARALRTLVSPAEAKVWVVAGMKTDTSYAVGTPRQVAELSPTAARKYRRDAVVATRRIREAFAPAPCPLDTLRLELDEVWSAGALLARFDEHAALAGLVRRIEPSMLHAGVASERGICHIDDERLVDAPRRLSANLYLGMPPQGGELRIWDVAPGEANRGNHMHSFIVKHSFKEGSQELIHAALPRPQVIRPRPGDLVLIDVARPHAVAGFTRGSRTTIQSWVVAPADRTRPLRIYA